MSYVNKFTSSKIKYPTKEELWFLDEELKVEVARPNLIKKKVNTKTTIIINLCNTSGSHRKAIQNINGCNYFGLILASQIIWCTNDLAMGRGTILGV